MAAPMKKWIWSRTSFALLNLLAKKSVAGPRVVYSFPLNTNNVLKQSGSRFFAFPSLSFGKYTSPWVTKHGRRQLSSEGPSDKDNRDRLPLKLMEFPKIYWPGPLKACKNFLLSLLLRRVDENFRTDLFLKGVEQAVVSVSELVSLGNFDALETHIDRQAVQEICSHWNRLSPSQRRYVAVKKEDIVMKCIYKIGMIFDDETESRHVEITVTIQGLHGFYDAGLTLDDFYVCNYRFIRDFTKGQENEWTINKLNHYKICEL